MRWLDGWIWGAQPVPGEVTAAARKRYLGPGKPHYARIHLCALHARLEAAEPLPDADRAELQQRRAEAAHWERVRVRQAAALAERDSRARGQAPRENVTGRT